MSARTRIVVTVIIAMSAWTQVAAQTPSADELLERMRAAYAALETYADTGTLVNEDKSVGAPLIIERSSFTTRFAAPRRFHFEFKKTPTVTEERYVIWCAGETFATWWSATQTTESYAQGEGQNAFALGEFPTGGTALLISPLLFAGAGLHGPIADFASPTYVGTETIADRPYHILGAKLRVNHWSETTRAAKIWIDVETYLVHKIVQDTPTDMGSGVVQRVTVTFEPTVNPPLDPAAFVFTPPAG